MIKPRTPAQRARAWERRAINSGARRLPGGMLSPEGAAALEHLRESGYAPSLRGCIERALIEAASLPDGQRD